MRHTSQMWLRKGIAGRLPLHSAGTSAAAGPATAPLCFPPLPSFASTPPLPPPRTNLQHTSPLFPFPFNPPCCRTPTLSPPRRNPLACTWPLLLFTHSSHLDPSTGLPSWLSQWEGVEEKTTPICSLALRPTVMSHTMCSTWPPPTAYPATMAITGLGSRRIWICTETKRGRIWFPDLHPHHCWSRANAAV